MSTKSQTELAQWACDHAKKAGAREARVSVGRTRFTRLEYRDRRIDTLKESTVKGLDIDIYIDGKYSAHRTSDLRREALRPFIEDTVAMTRYLTADQHRRLPDPEYYAGRREIDLELADAAYAGVRPPERHESVQRAENAAPNWGATASYRSPPATPTPSRNSPWSPPTASRETSGVPASAAPPRQPPRMKATSARRTGGRRATVTATI
jgi:predicted Zn-dependent protease